MALDGNRVSVCAKAGEVSRQARGAWVLCCVQDLESGERRDSANDGKSLVYAPGCWTKLTGFSYSLGDREEQDKRRASAADREEVGMSPLFVLARGHTPRDEGIASSPMQCYKENVPCPLFLRLAATPRLCRTPGTRCKCCGAPARRLMIQSLSSVYAFECRRIELSNQAGRLVLPNNPSSCLVHDPTQHQGYQD